MLYSEIRLHIQDAMRNKDKDKRDVLKMVVDKAKSIRKEQNPNDDSLIIEDDIILQAINRELKQLAQTKEALDKIGILNSLSVSTNNKIEILKSYLPKQLTEDEVRVKVSEILSGGSYDNFGAKMKVVMAELKGKADNKVIQKVVKEY